MGIKFKYFRDVLSKREKIIFFSLVLINAIPIFLFENFPTLDGGAHLYNSKLISEILSGNEFLDHFYEINRIYIPNWLGHFILMLLGVVMDMIWAEKLLLMLMVVLFPISFRYFVCQISENETVRLTSYLIIPFSYSITLHFGFYNFNLGICLLFIILGFYAKHYKSFKVKTGILLSCLFVLLFYAHFFVLLLSFILIFLHFLVKNLDELMKKKIVFKFFLHQVLKHTLIVFPVLFLCFLYLSFNELKSNWDSYDYDVLQQWFVNVEPLIGLGDYGLNYLIFYSMLVLSAYVILTMIITRKKVTVSQAYILISLFAIGLLYIFSPDSSQSAGYISIRLCLFFYILWIAFLSVFKINRYLLISTILIFTYFQYTKMKLFVKDSQIYSEIITDIRKSSNSIEENKVVLSLKTNGDWLLGHYPSYLGLDKPMVVLDNYEAYNRYFPIIWNFEDLPSLFLSDYIKSDIPCMNWPDGHGKGGNYQIDYVFIIGSEVEMQEEDCYYKLYKVLMKDFKLKYKSKFTLLYQKI